MKLLTKCLLLFGLSSAFPVLAEADLTAAILMAAARIRTPVIPSGTAAGWEGP